MEVIFEWDEKKSKRNVKAHGVSFEEAQTSFNDDLGLWMHAESHSKDEDRFILIGTSINFRKLVVVHCYREKADKEIIRIISARKANKSESKQYKENLP